MTEAPTEATARTSETEPPRRLGGSGGWIVGLLLALGIGLGGLYLWNELQRARSDAAAGEAWRLEAEALSARLDALDRRLQQLATAQRTIDARLGEVGANQGVIRDELLATSERAATIEDAVARLSDQRLRGGTQLMLNEVESLLVLAAQRLQLARDVDGARAALEAASAVLEGIEDPLFAGLKLPLTAEREQLAMLPADPLPNIRGVVAAALAALPTLPRAASIQERQAEATGTGDRVLQALSGLIRVRANDAPERALVGAAREAALEALRLDLRAALAAAEARDPIALEAALERARRPLARLFDSSAASVQALQARLDAIDASALAAPLPQLGVTLGELRALRGSRARLPLPAPPASSASASDAPRSEAETPLELEPESDFRPEPEPVPESAPESAPEPQLEPETGSGQQRASAVSSSFAEARR